MGRQLIYLISFVLVLFLSSSALADLIAYWPLDGDAMDRAGNHHGTLVGGANFISDASRGLVLSVDGVNGHVEVPHDDDMVFSSTDSYTIMAWVYLEALPGSWQTVMAKSRDQGTHYGIWITDSGEYMGGGWENRGSPAATQAWVHIAYVQDGDAGTGVTYVDGAEDWSGGPRDGTGAGDFWIGGAASVTEFLQGMIDEVRVYNHAMTEEEIQIVMLSGAEGYPLASLPNPQDGAFHADTWVTLSWRPGDFAVSHDVYLGDNVDDVSEATQDSPVFRGNQTTDFYVAGFPGFAYPDGLVPGTTYYWRIDEVNDADPNSPWKGDVWSFSIPPKTAYDPDPVDGAGIAETTVTLKWTGGFGAKLHTVYFGDDYDTVANATVGVPAGTTSHNPGPLEAEKVYYWRVDEFDGIGTYKGEVWVFATPGAVGNPQPANGATDVGMATVLSWTAAENAASHVVYLGLNKDTVRSADTASSEYKGSKALGAESFDPGLLEPDTTYYWRIDEVYTGNTVKGPVWSFTVSPYLLIEDFESYTDNDAAGEAIWQTWVDGFGVPDNGARVGNLVPPYCEQMIVHGGAQSMPLFYTNEGGVTNSEASLTLVSPRDWTTAGVGELSLWFRGGSGNAAEPLYVSVANTTGAPAVMAHDDINAAQVSRWMQWTIPLQGFADQGVHLTDVDSIAIGLGSKGGVSAGGSGTMFIDDIRLYRQ